MESRAFASYILYTNCTKRFEGLVEIFFFDDLFVSDFFDDFLDNFVRIYAY